MFALLLAAAIGPYELAPAAPAATYELAPATETFTTRVTLGAAAAAPVALASHGRPVARAARLVARPVHRAKGLIRKLPVLRRLGICGLRGCR